jgi:fructose-1,6-bisphosphatase
MQQKNRTKRTSPHKQLQATWCHSRTSNSNTNRQKKFQLPKPSISERIFELNILDINLKFWGLTEPSRESWSRMSIQYFIEHSQRKSIQNRTFQQRFSSSKVAVITKIKFSYGGLKFFRNCIWEAMRWCRIFFELRKIPETLIGTGP